MYFNAINFNPLMCAQTINPFIIGNVNSNSRFVSNTCRLCTNVSSDAVPIFDESNGNPILSKINKCFPSILVNETDLKPKQICQTCTFKLNMFFEFIEMALNADSKLEALLQCCLIQNEQLHSNRAKFETNIPIQQANNDSFVVKEEFSHGHVDQYFVQHKPSPIVLFNESNNRCLNENAKFNSDISKDVVLLLGLTCKDYGETRKEVTYQMSNAKGELNSLPFITTDNSKFSNVTDDKGCNLLDVLEPTVNTDNTVTLNYEISGTNEHFVSAHEPVSKEKQNREQSDIKSSNPSNSEFRCNICDRLFSQKNRLNTHMLRHSTERPHLCDKCEQKFRTKWDLTLHLRIHSGIYTCDFCGKAFPAKGKLERHRRTHTGERPYPCLRCNRAFSEKRNLRNHQKVHECERATVSPTPSGDDSGDAK